MTNHHRINLVSHRSLSPLCVAVSVTDVEPLESQKNSPGEKTNVSSLQQPGRNDRLRKLEGRFKGQL